MQQRSSTRLLILALLVALLPTAVCAQDVPDGKTQERKDPTTGILPIGPALLSVWRHPTLARGVYLRQRGGKLRCVWKGEPYDACALPDRTTLICERMKGTVIRVDANGNEITRITGLDRPVDAELTRDGKTLVVVLNGSGTVVGLDATTGAQKWSRGGFQNHFDALPLADGGVLVADSGNGRVVELAPNGKVRWEATGLRFPNTIDRLKNGRTLVTTYNYKEVIELDAKGKVVWRITVPGGGSVFRAVRRRDGTTVVIVGEVQDEKGKIHVVDRMGRILHTETFSPGCRDFEPMNDI